MPDAIATVFGGMVFLFLLFAILASPERTEEKDQDQPVSVMDAIVTLTVSGVLMKIEAASGREGSVLVLGSEENLSGPGRYYVQEPIHAMERKYPIGSTVRLHLRNDARPVDGVYDARLAA